MCGITTCTSAVRTAVFPSRWSRTTRGLTCSVRLAAVNGGSSPRSSTLAATSSLPETHSSNCGIQPCRAKISNAAQSRIGPGILCISCWGLWPGFLGKAIMPGKE